MLIYFSNEIQKLTLTVLKGKLYYIDTCILNIKENTGGLNFYKKHAYYYIYQIFKIQHRYIVDTNCPSLHGKNCDYYIYSFKL